MRPAAPVVVGVAVAVAAIDPQLLGSRSWLQPVALFATAFAALAVAVGSDRLTLAGPLRWFGAWLVWAGVSAVLSPTPGASLLAVGTFAAVAAATVAVVRAAGTTGLSIIFGAAGAASIVIAAAAELAGIDGGFAGRLRLLFLEPNQLARAAGLLVILFAALTLDELLKARDPRRLALALGPAVAAGLVLLLTQSRTGVAATAVGVIMVIGSQLSRQLSIATLVTIGLLIGGAAVAVLTGSAGDSINQSLSRSASQPTDELQTLNGRTVLWPRIVDVGLDRPVRGVGLGRDRDVVSQFEVEGRVVWNPQHTHSLPLQLWLTTGTPGLVLGAAALVASALSVWRLHDSLERTVALGLVAALIVDGIAEPVLRVPSFGWIALIAAAAIGAGSPQFSRESTVVTRPSISSTARS